MLYIVVYEEGVVLIYEKIVEGFNVLVVYWFDIFLMEGVGGWWLLFIIGSDNMLMYYFFDVVKVLKMDVILVVGMCLGCLNYVFLIVEVICVDGLIIKGWVVNDIIGNMIWY